MRTRAEAAAMARRLMDDDGSAKVAFRKERKGTYYPHHFGVCELRLLLDYIYKSKPVSEDEKL